MIRIVAVARQKSVPGRRVSDLLVLAEEPFVKRLDRFRIAGVAQHGLASGVFDKTLATISPSSKNNLARPEFCRGTWKIDVVSDGVIGIPFPLCLDFGHCSI